MTSHLGAIHHPQDISNKAKFWMVYHWVYHIRTIPNLSYHANKKITNYGGTLQIVINITDFLVLYDQWYDAWGLDAATSPKKRRNIDILQFQRLVL